MRHMRSICQTQVVNLKKTHINCLLIVNCESIADYQARLPLSPLITAEVIK